MVDNIKTAMVAAVNAALKYKELHPKAEDGEIINHVVSKSDAILESID